MDTLEKTQMFGMKNLSNINYLCIFIYLILISIIWLLH